MRFCLIPDICLPDIDAITPEFLQTRGITLLLLDLDNTLTAYSECYPTEKVLTWIAGCRAAGVDLFLVSNSRHGTRAKEYAQAAGIPFIRRAGKPHPRGLFEAMQKMNRRPEETAMAGDQIFTDGLAANRAGVLSILLRPICMKAPHRRLRYLIEQPIRALGREKIR